MNILQKIRAGEIEHTEPNDGIVSSTYITEDYVVQEPSHGNGGRLKKNRFFSQKLHQNGLNVPEVIEFSEDPLYVVFERLSGEPLENTESFEEDEYLEAVKNAGKALAAIHDQEGSGYGKPERENLEQGKFDSWRDFVQDYRQSSLDYVEDERFRHIVETAAEIIDIEEIPENPGSHIMHMDYTPDNIIVDEDLDVGVIDFDDVRYGDPGFDLMYAEIIMSKRGDEAAEKFMKGYRESRQIDLSEKLRRNYRALAVLREARGGEWCIRKDKDVDIEEWHQGLENIIEDLN